jgi:hypothetical protein
MRGAVSMALAYNQVWATLLIRSFGLRAVIVVNKDGNWYIKTDPNNCLMQFTRSGHTQLRSNAIMITSTITVVLFSTVVSISFVVSGILRQCPLVLFHYRGYFVAYASLIISSFLSFIYLFCLYKYTYFQFEFLLLCINFSMVLVHEMLKTLLILVFAKSLTLVER